MAAYIGYYRPVPGFLEENQTKARSEGASPDPRMQQRVRELPEKLPAGCTILGAYAPMAGPVFSDTAPPGVLVVDTNNTADLTFINQHYAGFLVFQWLPATVIGATRAEREAATAGPVAASGARR
jgi:hypothetical protein